jgi:ribosomal protein S18 acetylase RimI-like enzyme
MSKQSDLAGIDITENGDVDVAQLNSLYRLVGWDRAERRTRSETARMLELSQYRVAAHSTGGELVGFARVCGDPYVVQVLDVITHPAFRRRGIATRCMRGVLGHLRGARYVTVTLTNEGSLEAFYERFGFEAERVVNMIWKPPA